MTSNQILYQWFTVERRKKKKIDMINFLLEKKKKNRKKLRFKQNGSKHIKYFPCFTATPFTLI